MGLEIILEINKPHTLQAKNPSVSSKLDFIVKDNKVK